MSYPSCFKTVPCQPVLPFNFLVRVMSLLLHFLFISRSSYSLAILAQVVLCQARSPPVILFLSRRRNLEDNILPDEEEVSDASKIGVCRQVNGRAIPYCTNRKYSSVLNGCLCSVNDLYLYEHFEFAASALWRHFSSRQLAVSICTFTFYG